MARYLVTGATGFLGTHLVRALVKEGHSVVALSRKGGTFDGDVTARKGDVLHPASIRDAAAGVDGIFHAAGNVSRKLEDAEALHRVHVEGTRAVVHAAKEAKVPRLVVASSSGTVAVSAAPSFIATEESETPVALLSRWPYYRAKWFAEKAALEANDGDLQVISVNPTLLLGPGDIHGSSTEDVRLFLEKKIPAVPPGGISYVDARDAARGMLLAMTKGTPGRRYLLGACNVTLREFFARLERVSGVPAPWIPLPRGADRAKAGVGILEKVAGRFGLTLPVDPVSLDMAHHYWYLDASRAEAELGWRARDPIETLADTVRDLRDRGVVWPSAS